jgi:alpha-glucosidase
VRPLCWEDPGNRELRAEDEAFLLGDALLVAPVLKRGATQRALSLPPGEWRELEGGGSFRGPGRTQLDAPLDRIPVLVKAGSLLPMAAAEGVEGGAAGQEAEGVKGAGREPDRGLALVVFRPAGEEGCEAGLLYSDAGDGYGPHRVDRFALQPAPGGWSLSASSEGEYPWPYDRTSLELRGFHPGERVISLDLRSLPRYSG